METATQSPTPHVLAQVGVELVRRRRWAEADALLSGSPASGTDASLSAILAEARYELGRYPEALDALARLDTDPANQLRNARLHVLCLERTGRSAEAREAARTYLSVDPSDVAINAVMERLEAPVPEGGQHGADPFFTVERAERYVHTGRVDKAIRAYRRILLHHPGDLGLLARLHALSAVEAQIEDDLSEELIDPGAMPPEPLAMPEPLLSTPVTQARWGDTPRAVPRAGEGKLLEEAPSPEEVTELMGDRKPPPSES